MVARIEDAHGKSQKKFWKIVSDAFVWLSIGLFGKKMVLEVEDVGVKEINNYDF